MKITLHFYECEHQGDMDTYLEDVRASGATVLSSNVNHDAETGSTEITVPDEDRDEFWKKFKETNAYEYLN